MTAPKQFLLYKDNAWRVPVKPFSENSRKLAASAKGYKNETGGLLAIPFVIATVPGTKTIDSTKGEWV